MPRKYWLNKLHVGLPMKVLGTGGERIEIGKYKMHWRDYAGRGHIASRVMDDKWAERRYLPSFPYIGNFGHACWQQLRAVKVGRFFIQITIFDQLVVVPKSQRRKPRWFKPTWMRRITK